MSDSLISSTFDSRNGEALGQIALRIVAASEHLFERCPFAPQHLGRGQLSGDRRQSDDETRATNRRFLHIDAATQRPNRLRHHGQAKAGTPAIAAAGIVKPGEPLEDSRSVTKRNTGTIIIKDSPGHVTRDRMKVSHGVGPVSYTHLTLPTNREV